MIHKKMVATKTEPRSIAYVATFPPRACGIATFTQDLTNAIDNLYSPAITSKIIAINLNDTDAYHYPSKVIFEISQNRKSDYSDAAKLINENDDIKLANIQHEFGLFGGKYGSNILILLKKLKKPAVVTFHTVLPTPNDTLHKTVKNISAYVRHFIVMTHLAKMMLIDDYGISEEKIIVIPHGIHHRPFISSHDAKLKHGHSDRTIFTTFGFLSRGKGLEYVIEALPKVIEKFPNTLYMICGMTHPNVLKKEGETYRNNLNRQIHQLGISKHVKFYNRYLSLDDLFKFLEITDIYISTSLDPNQAVSGTLSYALGTGRPVISTAFSQAKELVTPKVGMLVPPRDSNAFAQAMIEMLEREDGEKSPGMTAYQETRHMTWQNVAIRYMNTFAHYSTDIQKTKRYKQFPVIKIDHIENMTDDFGIFQFAKITEPDTKSGYTLDDNARALIAIVLYYERFKKKIDEPNKHALKKRLHRLMNAYLNVMQHVSKPDGYFENYVNYDKSLNDDANQRDSLEDANARALHALALTATNREAPKQIKMKALNLVKNSLEHHVSFKSPRAIGFYIKALCYLIQYSDLAQKSDLISLLHKQTKILVDHFNQHSSDDWLWFEHYLTYANAVLPEALIFAYQTTGEKTYFDIAKKTIEFLIDVHFINDIYVPIGQDGWFHKQGERSHFDQQPEDTSSMIQVLRLMYNITKNTDYYELMHRAFCWFLGDNASRQMVYDESTGGCCDGIHSTGINLNQGAESTVSYLIARLQF